MTIIYLSCAWVAGIWLGARLHLPLALSLIGLAPLPLLLFTRRRRGIILLSLSVITVFAAAAYARSNLDTVDAARLRYYNDSGTAELTGTIIAAPDARDSNTRLLLSVSGIKLVGGWHPVAGKALLFVPRYPAYNYGDVLLVTGKPQTPSPLSDFDYQGYLAHQGIYTTMLYPGIEVTGEGGGFPPLRWLYSLRESLSRSLARVLPEPQAALAQGIVLGMRGNIPPQVIDSFARTGTAHLLAISGLHLGIVAGIMLSLGIWLFGRRRYLYVWLALGTIWLYALLTGMNPPVVRGAIMASLFLAAELLGRQRSAITALCFAAAVMVGISPYILWDASFQMSFLAMAGLVFIYPRLQPLGRRAVRAVPGEAGAAAKAAGFASDSFCATIAALIAVWPLVAYYFGIIALVGPLATLLALPALPGIILTGVLAGALGLVALPVAQAVGWLAWLCLSYLLAVVNGLAALPAIEVNSVSAVLLAAYYPALAAALFLSSRTGAAGTAIARLKSASARPLGLAARLPVKWTIPPLLAAAALVSFTAASMPDGDLHVSFLDVGEGDAILVQRGSQQVLIDGGPSPQALDLELGRHMPFWDRTIEMVILTHPHQDHLAGLVEVLQRFQVEQVMYPEPEYTSPLYDEWLRLIAEKGIRSTAARAGQQIDLGGSLISVLNPPPEPLTGTESDIDNNSVVLRLSDGAVSFLLTGDTMQSAEWGLILQRAGLASTVLKVAHHGSDSSTTAEFLSAVSPRVVVISVGRNNGFGHPDPSVLSLLEAKLGTENVFRTDEDGTVEFITDGQRLMVKLDDN
ncbi:MAG: DNA internalization-related competence protein ComEC/Rec2 [Chloroflexota bacterium]